MKKLYILPLLALMFVACDTSRPTPTTQDQLQTLKAELLVKRAEVSTITKKIALLQQELRTHNKAVEVTPTLVHTFTLQPRPFRHEIEVRGSVQSDKNIIVGAEASGRIKRIKVTVGNYVKKGTLLIMLDTQLLTHSLEELDNERALAKLLYKRQKNLWEKEIGTEFQYLEAKSRFKALQKRRKTLLTQIGMAHVRAPFSGTVEEFFVKEGEMAVPGTRLLRITNLTDIYVYAEVSDAYANQIKVGAPARVKLLVNETVFRASVSHVSRVLKKASRTFPLRVAFKEQAKQVLPHQVVVLFIEDYASPVALTVPARLLRKHEKGHYLYVATGPDDNKIAQKVHVEIGYSYNNQTEIVAGLTAGAEIIDQGALDVADGAHIAITSTE